MRRERGRPVIKIVREVNIKYENKSSIEILDDKSSENGEEGKSQKKKRRTEKIK